MTQAAADAEGQYPRKRLADCLAVPATTGVVCPQDLTALPRPASCPAGRAYTPPIHPIYTPYTPPIHPLYTPHTTPILPLYTPHTPHHRGAPPRFLPRGQGLLHVRGSVVLTKRIDERGCCPETMTHCSEEGGVLLR